MDRFRMERVVRHKNINKRFQTAMDENMVLFCRLRDLSGHLCLLFAVLTFAADVIGRKWVRIGIDLLIFLYQFPLWVLAGVVLLLIFPSWV